MSVPAETEFAAMFVPSCARAKAEEIMKTPKRCPELAPSWKLPRSCRGFQMGSPYMTLEDDDTMIPMKEVTAKPTGIVMS